MKRISYLWFTIACGVLLHGSIHGAEVSAPLPITQANLTQSSNKETRTMVVAQAEGGRRRVPEGLLPPPPTMTPLPGEFAILVGGYWLTAVGGGRHITEAFHTDLKDASKIGSWEKFKLFVEPGFHRTYAIQTASGNYVTAVDGGGRSTEPVLQTNQVEVKAWEKFNLFQDWIYHFIRVSSGQFLGPNFVSDKGIYKVVGLRTDVTKAQPDLLLYKCGDPGPDSAYMIAWANTGDAYKYIRQIPLQAYGGGGLLNGAMGPYSGASHYGVKFRLLRQGDGSYALQTENGQNYVTAVGGGGQVVAPVLQTNRTQVQAWEKFRLWILPDCAYAFQTASGHWLGMSEGRLETRISGTSIRDFNRFRLYPADFEPPSRDHRSP